ncbi:MAG TPA: 4Fe-4S dicluster domain-containing protein [Anaerolineales bacterium]|nr:4Fe-4S dicluster domain-containing protein [Anaerolineales bacterium]
MAETATQARAPTFFQQVIDATPGYSNLEMCIQCGTCGGSCPSGPDMDHTPRTLFAMIRAVEVEPSMKERILRSNTFWYCVSCYHCMERCPQEVHITDIMYTLKRISVKENIYDSSKAPDFSKTFINWVENYGRAFELGLMGQHLALHNPFGAFKLAGMGIGMVTKGRMAFTPTPIKDVKGLKAILAKAKEIEETL